MKEMSLQDSIIAYHSLVDKKVDDAVSDIKRRIWWGAGIISVFLVLSGWLGFPQLRDYMIGMVSENFLSKEVTSQLKSLRNEVNTYSNLYAEASANLRLFHLQIEAESGNLNSYNQLSSLTNSSVLAKQLHDVVTSKLLNRITRYGQNLCMGEIGFKYVRLEQKSEKQLFETILKSDSCEEDFNNAIKTLANRHDDGSYLDFFVWYAINTDNIIRLCAAVDCIIYVHTFTPTLSQDEILNWWRINKRPEFCHGIDAYRKLGLSLKDKTAGDNFEIENK